MKRSRSYIAYRKVYSWPIKYVVFTFICALLGLCSIYIYFFYSQSSIDRIVSNESRHVLKKMKNPSFHGKKYVHLDLKGAAPKLTYYEYLFPLFASVGATGVVIEYEDMFPYERELHNISAFNSYSKNDIKLINDISKNNGLEIIPLVQTFGHLEFVLKLQEFQDLREVPEFPQTICPSNERSKKIIYEMISQVMESHPDSKIIHIGADETYFLGRCRECNQRMKAQNFSKEQLYLKHIEDVTKFIRNKYPHVLILMWDDQLRYILEDEHKYGMNGLNITPVVWQYETDVFDKLDPSLWNQYAQLFSHVWIASAFKGATGVDQYIVNMAYHIQNHRSWLGVIENYNNSINIDAIVLTGWQRYDHFSVLCELLPVGLPSLITNLKILESGEENHLGPSKEMADILKCAQPYALMGTSFGTPRCSFVGSEILENVYRLFQLKEDFEKLRNNPKLKGWMSEFHSNYNFSSPNQIYSLVPQLNHFKKELDEIEHDLEKALLEIYDIYTKDEWIFTYLKPLKQQISELLIITEKISNRNVWPRKPFNIEQ